MPDRATTLGILKALETASYYAILSVPKNASTSAIQDAFHRFALQYHPDRYVRETREAGALAAAIFKRGTEAFAILTDPGVRVLYDEGLARGHVRYIEGEAAQAARDALPRVKTLEEIASKPKAKELALRADRLLVAGKIEEARLLLIDAVQDDFENVELKARLHALYTAEGIDELKDVVRRAHTGVKVSAPPPPDSLEALATTPKAQELGRRADRLLAAGKVEEARVLLIDAVQDDFENVPLQARLRALYTADGVETLKEVTRPATASAPPAPGPAAPQSLEALATTPKAKELGRRADRLLAIKKYEEARILLTDAVQDDFENEELKARLHALYTVEGYERL